MIFDQPFKDRKATIGYDFT